MLRRTANASQTQISAILLPVLKEEFRRGEI